MSRSKYLFLLQKYDSDLDQSSKRISEIVAIVKDRSELTTAESEQDLLAVTLKDKKKLLLEAELQVQAQMVKIEQNQTKLYSGAITNPKELEDLQLESNALQKYLGVLEERQLEAMVDAEQSQLMFNQAESKSDQIAADLITRDEILTAEKTELEKNINRLNSERSACLKNSDIPDLSTYQNKRKSLKGIAVALMISDNCSSCGSSIPSATAQEVRSPGKLTTCPNCSRILHPG